MSKSSLNNQILNNSNEVDSNSDETDLEMFDAKIAQLLNFNTENEEFDRFLEK